jgi:hypothetical protein
MYVQSPLFLSDFNENWIFLTVWINVQILNFMKILPEETELFDLDGRPDRQTDVTKLIVAFRNYVEEP